MGLVHQSPIRNWRLRLHRTLRSFADGLIPAATAIATFRLHAPLAFLIPRMAGFYLPGRTAGLAEESLADEAVRFTDPRGDGEQAAAVVDDVLHETVQLAEAFLDRHELLARIALEADEEETGIELGVARATLSKHMVGPYIEKLGKRGEDGPYRLRTPDPDPAVS